MSGHSKWAQIKRQKAVNDAHKGQAFTKLAREITVAAREGGSDPDANFRLRLAIQHARDANLPNDNIERAIKKATGGVEGDAVEEIVYEGYGPGGVAVMIQAMTDNRNRTVSEVRSIFNRAGGSLGESGCVAWIFEPRGIVNATVDGRDPEDVALVAIDAGAEDVQADGASLEIQTDPGRLEDVRLVLEQQNVHVEAAQTTMLPKTTVSLGEEEALQILRLIDRFEDLDDVQKVYTNVEFDEAILEKYSA